MKAKTLSLWFFCFFLFAIPLFFHPDFLFADSVKRALLMMGIAALAILGPGLQAWQGKGLAFPIGKKPLLLFLAVASLSLFWSQSFPFALESWMCWALGLMIACLTIWLLEQANQEGKDGTKSLFQAILVSALFASVYGILQSLGIDFPGLPYDSKKAPVSSFGNTNHASEYLAPAIAIAFGLASTDRKIWGRIGLITLCAIGLYLSTVYVRAGLLAGAAAVLALVILFLIRTRGRSSLQLLIPLAALVLSFFVAQSANDSMDWERETRKEQTLSVRERNYFHAMPDMIAARPIGGWGIGQFPVAFPAFRDAEERRISSQDGKQLTMLEEPHNDYLLLLSELGILGLIPMAWFAVLLFRSWKWAVLSPTASMAFAGLCAIAVNALFRSPLSNPSSQLLFWVLLGIFSFETNLQEKITAKPGKRIAFICLALASLFVIWGAKKGFAEWQLSRFFQDQRKDIALLQSASNWDPWDVKKLEILGHYQRKAQGDLLRSRESFESLLRLNPNHVGGRVQLAQILLEQGNTEQAFQEIQTVRRLDPELRALDLKELGRRAEEFELEKQKRGERADFSKTKKLYDLHLRLHPDDADTWMAIGQLFRNEGDEAESKRSWAQAHRLYGIEHLRARKFDDALRQFRLFEKFSAPDDPKPKLFFAALALHKSNREEAKGLLKELADLGARQSQLRESGLEILASDPEMRSILNP